MAINPATGLEDANYTPVGSGIVSNAQGSSAGAVKTSDVVGSGATPPIDPNAPVVDPNAAMKDAATATTTYTPPTTPEITARTIGSKETVAGQLNDLLNQDSTYMQSAKANAMAQANSRGLLNSSMAVGASQKAAIDSSLPIAQADANINANAGQEAQQAGHQAQLTGYQGEVNAGLQTLQSDEARKTAAAQGLIQTTTNQQNIDANVKLQQQAKLADFTLQTQLKQMGLDLDYAKLDADQRKEMTNILGPMSQQLMSEKQKIMAIPDSQMGRDTKLNWINQLDSDFQRQYNIVAAVSGVQLTWQNATGGVNYQPPAANNTTTGGGTTAGGGTTTGGVTTGGGTIGGGTTGGGTTVPVGTIPTTGTTEYNAAVSALPSLVTTSNPNWLTTAPGGGPFGGPSSAQTAMTNLGWTWDANSGQWQAPPVGWTAPNTGGGGGA